MVGEMKLWDVELVGRVVDSVLSESYYRQDGTVSGLRADVAAAVAQLVAAGEDCGISSAIVEGLATTAVLERIADWCRAEAGFEAGGVKRAGVTWREIGGATGFSDGSAAARHFDEKQRAAWAQKHKTRRASRRRSRCPMGNTECVLSGGG